MLKRERDESESEGATHNVVRPAYVRKRLRPQAKGTIAASYHFVNLIVLIICFND